MKWRIVTTIIGALVCSGANATIYTWVDVNGIKHFSDIARTPEAKKADPGTLQMVESDGSALAFARRLAAQKQQNKKVMLEKNKPSSLKSAGKTAPMTKAKKPIEK